MPDSDKQTAAAEPNADTAAAAKETAENAKDESPKTAKGGAPLMHVRIASPFKVFFDDDAFSISGENATGPFDILPKHHNFISLLGECKLTVRTPQSGDIQVQISGGIMHVKADRVVVFLNI